MQGRIRPPSSESQREPRPERLGDFRIVGEIGRGGMGMIYEAVQEPFQRRVAVKTVRGELQRISGTTRDRFLREQMVLAKLHHSHIVPIHAAGEVGSLHYYAMQYIEGAALNQMVTTLRLSESSNQSGKTPSIAELAESAERKRAEKVAIEEQPVGNTEGTSDPKDPGDRGDASKRGVRPDVRRISILRQRTVGCIFR